MYYHFYCWSQAHPQIEGRTLAQQIKDKHDAIKQGIHKIDKEHDFKQTNSIKKKPRKSNKR
jgi:hypothetical protein